MVDKCLLLVLAPDTCHLKHAAFFSICEPLSEHMPIKGSLRAQSYLELVHYLLYSRNLRIKCYGLSSAATVQLCGQAV